MRFATLSRAGSILMLLGLGCSSNPEISTVPRKEGNLVCPLTASGPSDSEYRLRDATFEIWGYGRPNGFAFTRQILSSESALSSDSISVSVGYGYYDVYLTPGWRMEYVRDSVAETVEATLSGSNYKSLFVEPDRTNWVSFKFAVGEQIIALNGKQKGNAPANDDPARNTIYGDELLTSETLDTGWIASESNSAGVQGVMYTYGDDITCVPPIGNPCTAGGCCLVYSTIADPSHQSWGCGLGLQLGAELAGPPDFDFVGSAYAGSARGFAVTFENTGNAPVRLSYTQKSHTPGMVSPSVGDLPPGQVVAGFMDVKCPALGDVHCAPATPNPYDLQLQVVGGDGPADGKLCITSIKPFY